MKLYWHPYKYFPYEKELAVREVQQLTGQTPETTNDVVSLPESAQADTLRKLAYFSYFGEEGVLVPTTQRLLETANDKPRTSRRQVTRYSSHGLHEYKGKFNPQVVRSLLNIFGPSRQPIQVLDPFCGSGTTLVEAVHAGNQAFGFDINPMAVFISTAKLQALSADSDLLTQYATIIIARCRASDWLITTDEDERYAYLMNWFPATILVQMETLRHVIAEQAQDSAAIFLVLVSNLLRDYSLQEPADLRIRRRSSPFPTTSFLDAVEQSFHRFLCELRATQAVLGRMPSIGRAMLHDIRQTVPNHELIESFDIAVTSPPYATALPYIDTQRLSLVWLGLSQAKAINSLEETLIGSR